MYWSVGQFDIEIQSKTNQQDVCLLILCIAKLEPMALYIGICYKISKCVSFVWMDILQYFCNSLNCLRNICRYVILSVPHDVRKILWYAYYIYVPHTNQSVFSKRMYCAAEVSTNASSVLSAFRLSSKAPFLWRSKNSITCSSRFC